MNFRQLEIFRAVMDAGSATAAARVLGLSQPAVSRQLAQLETEVGLDLFARERGKLIPTAHATALYREAAHAFEGVERVLNLVSRMRANNTGTLRIAVPHSFCEVLLPRIIARLAVSHPNLRYAVEFGNYEAIASMVARREVDVGIVKDPVEHLGISKIVLVESKLVCALPHNHPLAALRVIPIADIAAEPLILLGQAQHLWREELQALFRRTGHMPAVRLETHAVGAACGFVANGLGISIVPEILGAQFVERGIVLRPLAVRIEQCFSVGFPKGLQRAGLVAEFAAAARQVVSDLLQETRQVSMPVPFPSTSVRRTARSLVAIDRKRTRAGQRAR